jgi:multiple sugar transport system permease protein
MTTTVEKKSTSGLTPLGNKPKSNVWKNIRMYAGFVVIVVWGLAPFYWMVATSFRPVAFTYDTSLWPTNATWDNYKTAFDTSLGNNFGQSLINSVIIAGISTLIGVAVGVFASYALARLEFKGKYLVLGFVLAASMFPGVALVTPLFQFFTDIGWFGTYQALIIPNISFVLPLTIYTLTAFFREMPWELEEAAKIDGATPGQAFRKVILPLAAPGLVTAGLLTAFFVWNEFLLAQTLTSSPKAFTVPVSVANFTGSQKFEIPLGTISAASVVITVPLVLAVILFQKRIVAGMTAGAVKG